MSFVFTAARTHKDPFAARSPAIYVTHLPNPTTYATKIGAKGTGRLILTNLGLFRLRRSVGVSEIKTKKALTGRAYRMYVVRRFFYQSVSYSALPTTSTSNNTQKQINKLELVKGVWLRSRHRVGFLIRCLYFCCSQRGLLSYPRVFYVCRATRRNRFDVCSLFFLNLLRRESPSQILFCFVGYAPDWHPCTLGISRTRAVSRFSCSVYVSFGLCLLQEQHNKKRSRQLSLKR